MTRLFVGFTIFSILISCASLGRDKPTPVLRRKDPICMLPVVEVWVKVGDCRACQRLLTFLDVKGIQYKINWVSDEVMPDGSTSIVIVPETHITSSDGKDRRFMLGFRPEDAEAFDNTYALLNACD